MPTASCFTIPLALIFSSFFFATVTLIPKLSSYKADGWDASKHNNTLIIYDISSVSSIFSIYRNNAITNLKYIYSLFHSFLPINDYSTIGNSHFILLNAFYIQVFLFRRYL